MMDERAVTGGVKDLVIAGNRLTVGQPGKRQGQRAVALVLAQVLAVTPCTNWRMGISTLKQESTRPFRRNSGLYGGQIDREHQC